MGVSLSKPRQGDLEARPARPDRLSLSAALVVVAAIAAECALVVQIRRCYAAIPAFSSPLCPEFIATPAVLLWIVLGSLATYAWRGSSVTRLAAQVAISSVLVLSRLNLPGASAGVASDVLWPVGCFGAFVVLPLLLWRFSRIGDRALVVADSAAVALLTYHFAVAPYVPRM
jgi:hypothetical protein